MQRIVRVLWGASFWLSSWRWKIQKKKDGYHQKVNKTTDCDAFQYIPIDHIDERLVYLWGAGFGRGVVMMA
jgi:hypothetical protein